MANALGTLFSDIANAIRGKNGETGTMKPAEFPEKIAAIETGGGGSGGGGAVGLVKTETRVLVTPSSAIVYNGKLYVFGYYSTAGTYALTRLDGDTWTIVHTFATGISDFYSGAYAALIVFDGKLHFLGGGKTAHFVYDGATMTKGVALPADMEQTNAAFVENGKLHFHETSSGSYSIYRLDGDSWVDTGVDAKNNYGYASFDGKVYCKRGADVKIYANGVFTTVATNSAWSGHKLVVVGENLYLVYNNNGFTNIYKMVGGIFEDTGIVKAYETKVDIGFDGRLQMFGGSGNSARVHTSMELP